MTKEELLKKLDIMLKEPVASNYALYKEGYKSGVYDSIEVVREYLNSAVISMPSEIYVACDDSDGEVLCAFVDRDRCTKEALDCGCGMQTVRLY